jgi:hypothetical protein
MNIAISIESIIEGHWSGLSTPKVYVRFISLCVDKPDIVLTELQTRLHYDQILAGLDLGAAAICDILITASLCYYFYYHKGGFKR